MIKKMRKMTSLLTCFAMAISSVGCSYNPLDYFSKEKTTTYDEPMVVDVFDSLANYQGIQSGWFAKIVKEKFNMELNIIAPNVSGGGTTLFETRAAAGNIGDLIICSGENDKLADLVSAGLVMDMAPLLKDKNVMKYHNAIDQLNDPISKDGIYGIPSEISSLSASTPSEGPDLTYGAYLRWDAYKELGYPNIATLEDLLPILKDMQTLIPSSDSGKQTYAFSFFKDWDGNLMNSAKQPTCFYGYDEIGFVLAKADGSDYQNILDDNSQYIRVLKLYFDANQMGLVDPDSTTQTYNDVFKKYQDGAVLFSPWPWLCQPAYNTTAHTNDGIGFMLAPIDDASYFSYGCAPEGNRKTIIAIGSQAKDPKRLADFIDWLYSPEGIRINGAQAAGGTTGPEGLTWEMGKNGPYLTEFGLKALFNTDTLVPDDWGGGTWIDGVSTLNYKAISQSELDPNGYPYYYNLWDSVINLDDTALSTDWKTHMKANSAKEYLEAKNQILVAPGSGYAVGDESSEISTLRNQCKSLIIDYSWKMIFASNETTFYRLLKELQTSTTSLGYEAVLECDMNNAILQNTARVNAKSTYTD